MTSQLLTTEVWHSQNQVTMLQTYSHSRRRSCSMVLGSPRQQTRLMETPRYRSHSMRRLNSCGLLSLRQRQEQSSHHHQDQGMSFSQVIRMGCTRLRSRISLLSPVLSKLHRIITSVLHSLPLRRLPIVSQTMDLQVRQPWGRGIRTLINPIKCH